MQGPSGIMVNFLLNMSQFFKSSMEVGKPCDTAQQRIQLHLHKQTRRLANLKGTMNKLPRPGLPTALNDIHCLRDNLAAFVQHINNDDPLSALDHDQLHQLLNYSDHDHVVRASTAIMFMRIDNDYDNKLKRLRQAAEKDRQQQRRHLHLKDKTGGYTYRSLKTYMPSITMLKIAKVKLSLTPRNWTSCCRPAGLTSIRVMSHICKPTLTAILSNMASSSFGQRNTK